MTVFEKTRVPGNPPVEPVVDDAERSLVERAKAGDHDAFSQLYRNHAPLLSRRLRRVFGQVADAQDVLQMTFVEVHRSLHTFDTSRSFRAWVSGIAFRVAGHHLRATSRRSWQRLLGFGDRGVDEVAADGAVLMPGASEDKAIAQQLSRELYRVLAELPEKKRIAFVLSQVEQMSLVEISEILGATPQTIWARVESARKLIASRLGDYRSLLPKGDKP